MIGRFKKAQPCLVQPNTGRQIPGRDGQLNMSSTNGLILNVTAFIIVIQMAVALADYRLYEHCYQEGGACGTKEIACENGSVIDIIRSVVGYSEYWALDGSRTNCTAMNDTCYGEVTDPVELCSRSSRCELETCSNFTRQRLSCLVVEVTNVLQINYTCVGMSTTAAAATTTTTDPGMSTTTATTTTTTTRTTTATTTTTTTDPDHSVMIVLCVVVPLLIIAVIVIVVVLVRKRSAAKVHREASNSGSERDEAGNEDDVEVERNSEEPSQRTVEVPADDNVTNGGSLPALPATVVVQQSKVLTKQRQKASHGEGDADSRDKERNGDVRSVRSMSGTLAGGRLERENAVRVDLTDQISTDLLITTRNVDKAVPSKDPLGDQNSERTTKKRRKKRIKAMDRNKVNDFNYNDETLADNIQATNKNADTDLTLGGADMLLKGRSEAASGHTDSNRNQHDEMFLAEEYSANNGKYVRNDNNEGMSEEEIENEKASRESHQDADMNTNKDDELGVAKGRIFMVHTTEERNLRINERDLTVISIE